VAKFTNKPVLTYQITAFVMPLLSYLPDIDFTHLLKQEKSARGDIRAKQL
jgi:hypothetical protein